MLAQRQETYWWHRARRLLAASLLLKYGVATNPSWVDIGCGPGGNLRTLDALCPSRVVGVDISPIALSLAAKFSPASTLVQADINEPLPFDNASFDVVTVFNVLYHEWIRDEAAILQEVNRILKPSGLLLVTEPAFENLKREMDYIGMARRRYTNVDFDELLRNADFESVFATYFTSFGAPLLIARGALKRAKKLEQVAPDMRSIPSPLNELLFRTAMVENSFIVRGASLPIGTTLLRVARRR